MITTTKTGAYLLEGKEVVLDQPQAAEILNQKLGYVPDKKEARKGTISYSILEAHNTSGDMEKLKIKFDVLASHDITYVGIIQTARNSGLEKFPIPYVLTNCHNTLAAVGGTINEDDHLFGLSAAQKYGGIYVPPHMAVIHQYMREMYAGGANMILGSDSHTRYGAMGCLAMGEGGPELVKQLVGRTYDIDRPEVVAIYLTGKPLPGVGPMDVALAIIGEVFEAGTVKNKIIEFVGEGVSNLSAEFRIGIDVMSTETTCLSSIWQTDEKIKGFLTEHRRPDDYKLLQPAPVTYYDALVEVDLSQIRPMIAMPFHPANTYTIEEFNANLPDILDSIEKKAIEQLGNPQAVLQLKDKVRNGGFYVDQAEIVGCSGGNFENICDAVDILEGYSVGNGELSLSVYPSSQAINMELMKNGAAQALIECGASFRTAFCGPCFGAGDVPANRSLSLRHVTRNFPSREGSKPGEGQVASVAIADARSIAATVRNKGRLTPATDLEVEYTHPDYHFDAEIYKKRCYNGYGNAQPEVELVRGPNIADWPQMEVLSENLLLQMVCVITDPVTTTDELIPSGETSSYRSNPLRLAEFALSRKDPGYVGRAKEVQQVENSRREGKDILTNPALKEVWDQISSVNSPTLQNTGIGSMIYAVKPGDGSAREQAASCQKVLGTFANVAKEYATKRYRSNLINWGMLPFLFEDGIPFELGDSVYIPNIRTGIANGDTSFPAYLIHGTQSKLITLTMQPLTKDEQDIILAGCLMNYYKSQM